ncbi:Dabb family protein [Photorhabdus laumondii]|uniref:Stress protein n=1 Tax=Photorhabdus laumondii subsp. clarkei TaxID=2029685 RepID=A0A329VRF7_9GAMM|nr:Dabb family protein [Photorhabdus laumondii]RAW93111.1 stress protein [Photorhabdus laumondii subsp. clarkei]
MLTQRHGFHRDNRNIHPKLFLRFVSATAFIGGEFSLSANINKYTIINNISEKQKQQLTTIRDTAISMQHQIKGISSIEWGSNVNSENKNKGFTHAITMTFDDQKAISNYLSHPAHDKLKNLLTDSVDDIIVFDYEV